MQHATINPEEVELEYVPDGPVYVDNAGDTTRYIYAAIDPYSWELWEWPEGVELVHSGSRLIGYMHPDEWDDWALDMIAAGCQMYPVDYHEHGTCIWGLTGSVPRDRWDTVHNAGWIAIPDYSLTDSGYDDPAAVAAHILDEYTAACNGEGYLLIVETHTPDADPDVFVVGGFFGLSSIESAIRDELPGGMNCPDELPG